jgi:hypothetical protein
MLILTVLPLVLQPISAEAGTNVIILKKTMFVWNVNAIPSHWRAVSARMTVFHIMIDVSSISMVFVVL